MAITYGAVSAKTDATGASTVAANYPTGVAAGHLALGIRNMMSGVNTVTFLDEPGWSELADFVGGTGNTADNHNSRLRVGSQVLTGSESGSVTFDASANCSCMAMMARYANATGSWDVVSTNGDDATHGANRSVTGGATLALAPGDTVVVVVSVDTDASLTITAPTITASGITFGSVTRRTSGAGSTAGLDGNIEIFDAAVTAGTATVTPSFSMTTATSQCGPVAIIRLREVSSATTYAATGTVAATTTVAGTVTSRLASTGTVAVATAVTGSAGVITAATQWPATGAVAATTAVSGSVTSRLPGSGTVAAVSGLVGTPTALLPSSGVIAAVSAAAGQPIVKWPITGAVAAVSALTGSPTALLSTTGTVAATSTVVGVPAARLGVSGTVAAVSTVAGNASLIGAPVQLPATGIIPATTTVAGTPTKLSPTTGQVSGVSSAIGTPTKLTAATGQVAGTTTVAGSVTLSLPVTGGVAATTTAVGQVAALLAALGSVGAVTSVTGAASVVGREAEVVDIVIALTVELLTLSPSVGTLSSTAAVELLQSDRLEVTL